MVAPLEVDRPPAVRRPGRVRDAAVAPVAGGPAVDRPGGREVAVRRGLAGRLSEGDVRDRRPGLSAADVHLRQGQVRRASGDGDPHGLCGLPVELEVRHAPPHGAPVGPRRHDVAGRPVQQVDRDVGQPLRAVVPAVEQRHEVYLDGIVLQKDLQPRPVALARVRDAFVRPPVSAEISVHRLIGTAAVAGAHLIRELSSGHVVAAVVL